MRSTVLKLLTTVTLAVALAGVAGCGGGSGSGSGSTDQTRSGGTGTADITGPLTVFAAASLTDVFGDLGARFMSEHPGTEVRFNFAGSSSLATQINQGAPADVFASANEKQMAAVTSTGEVAGEPVPFAENVLVIAVPPGNPGKITGLADFADPDLTLATCAPEVPCGAAAEAVFAAAGITPSVDTLEEDVRAALTKVELGEVDAALVYTTDAQSAGDAVQSIEFPESARAVNVYPIAVLKESPHPAAARAFVDLVLSQQGQDALRAAGFRPPAAP
ncbi:molybdate ABC transporter substrate-binding protein [Mycolicibacterium palauense]|uniref:molybdate ABC transporter substrate-binding protein n=1 Tax=Mycolicibacterium palauense TaxID=2034511 RepID=UPI000BFF0623|nr:molybdate ABC transporter substrate-binding protein [Mycolicibacterium palauense]